MAANRASMARRFPSQGGGLQAPPDPSGRGVQGMDPSMYGRPPAGGGMMFGGGMGTQGPGDGMAPPPMGMPGNPGGQPGGMGNPGGQPDFGPLIQAMGQQKPMMPGGTGAPPIGPGGLQSQPAPNQWNTTGRDQAMALLGSRSGRSPRRP
jgi:hypothetical protein